MIEERCLPAYLNASPATTTTTIAKRSAMYGEWGAHGLQTLDERKKPSAQLPHLLPV